MMTYMSNSHSSRDLAWHSWKSAISFGSVTANTMTRQRRAAELSAWCRKISIHLDTHGGLVNDIEILYLLDLKGFPFHSRTDWQGR
jgi:hypothetical protein